MANIVIYSSDLCPYCHRAKALLQRKKAAFTEIKVDFDPAKRAEMRQKAGGAGSVPQIWINDEHIGGSDELYALEAAGTLDEKLAVSA
ncbi:glutaredoxin 3 [Eilatimonas milleporae]|uniref:Glutaredoxin n=1 Tax=Eilatimonas milleporae TaxID=911205 RepID=A0A3M0BVC0_9PROT|nr:glutaredoxin 3 [Eilatimonas milleporae]RMB01524.1 glutaredoxin 3 [Eilatimonas milleporae]